MSTAQIHRDSGGNGLGRKQQESLDKEVTRRINGQRFDATDIRHVARVALDQAAHLVSAWLPEGRREGQEWVALNPTRRDTCPGSFKVNLSTGKWSDFATRHDGGDLVALFAYLKGITQGQAARLLAEHLAIPGYDHSLRRARLGKTSWTLIIPVPDSAPPPPEAHYKYRRPTSIWPYRDAQGGVLCYVYRFDSQNGKEILPLTFRRDNTTAITEWRWQALPAPRPLYNLDKLTANPTAVVILTEGEKAADAAAVLFPECVITTTLNGAQSPQKTDFSPLHGRTIWIWSDNDEPGRKYAERVTELLKGIAKVIKLLHIPGNHRDGWDAADALEEGWQPVQGGELHDAPEPSPVLNAGLAECFKVKDTGVYYQPSAEPGEDHKPPFWVCGWLQVAAYTRNSDGRAWGRLLEFKDPEGEVHSWAMPMGLLQMDGSAYRAILADRGLVIAPGRKARDLLTNYIQTAQPSAWVRCVERTGWHAAAFVFPDEIIGETGGERVLLQTDNNRRHVYQQAGTLTDWQREVAAPCVGNTRLTFGVSTAFASMLLYFFPDEENGGFHLRGSSSIGKSTILRVASSVFGGRIFMQSWRATANGLEAVAAQHNDSLLCLDELKQVDPKEVGEIIYMVVNGSGKGRADRAGCARARQTWRLLVLSSGEMSLEDHIITVGKRVYAGEETRLADIPADTGRYGAFEELHGLPSGEALARELKAAVERNHGMASREFVRRLTAPVGDGRLLEKLRARLLEGRHEFMTRYIQGGANGQVLRVATRFALVETGGELATELGITGWPEGEAKRAAAACFSSWLDARGGTGDQEIYAALSQVRRFFELHGESRFTPWETALAGDSRTMNRAGFRRVNEQGETEFYVLPEVFKREICAGCNWRQVARALVERDVLIAGENRRSMRKERLPGLGTVRCYRLTASVLQDV